MNFIIPNIDASKETRKQTRLNTIYCNVRHYMVTNFVSFAGGYVVPDGYAGECMSMLARYQAEWDKEGGDSDAFRPMNFDIRCDDADTYRQFKRTLRDAVNERLRKTLDGFLEKTMKCDGYSWAADSRCFKSLRKDIEYIKKYSGLYRAIEEIGTEVSSILADFREHPESCIRRLESVIENN